MSAATQVSLTEYLNTSYEPDREYLDGVLEERNVGKRKHSETQALLCAFFLSVKQKHEHRVLAEQRVRVSPTRVRIPDVCLVRQQDREEVAEHPPSLCVEILSPEDRWSRVQDRVRDYLAFGVQTLWIIDPYERSAWIATAACGVIEARDGILRCSNPELEVRLDNILPED